jgi:hypothetical protein
MVADNGNSVAGARDPFVDGIVLLAIPHSRDAKYPSSCRPSRIWLLPDGKARLRPGFGLVRPKKDADLSDFDH